VRDCCAVADTTAHDACGRGGVEEAGPFGAHRLVAVARVVAARRREVDGRCRARAARRPACDAAPADSRTSRSMAARSPSGCHVVGAARAGAAGARASTPRRPRPPTRAERRARHDLRPRAAPESSAFRHRCRRGRSPGAGPPAERQRAQYGVHGWCVVNEDEPSARRRGRRRARAGRRRAALEVAGELDGLPLEGAAQALLRLEDGRGQARRTVFRKVPPGRASRARQAGHAASYRSRARAIRSGARPAIR